MKIHSTIYFCVINHIHTIHRQRETCVYIANEFIIYGNRPSRFYEILLHGKVFYFVCMRNISAHTSGQAGGRSLSHLPHILDVYVSSEWVITETDSTCHNRKMTKFYDFIYTCSHSHSLDRVHNFE